MSASERSVYEEIIIESTVNASDTVDLRVGVERLDIASLEQRLRTNVSVFSVVITFEILDTYN